MISLHVWSQQQFSNFLILAESKQALEEIANELDIKYGSKDGQKLDVFFPKSQGKGEDYYVK